MAASSPHKASVRVAPDAATGAEADAEGLRAADPMTLVIFGASGDLCKRKLIPALFRLHEAGLLPERYAIFGCSRTKMSDGQFRDYMQKELKEHVERAVPSGHPLIKALHYHPGSAGDPAFFQGLRKKIEALEKMRGLPPNRIFYLAVAPQFFAPIIRNLQDAGLLHGRQDAHWSRVVVEKPFGRDLASARALNGALMSVLDESQIFRIDHYLGKETVQNVLSFRFGNALFEPLFNRKYVDHVQITVAESLGMEGRRGAYYDRAGALRDMVQNHLLQLLCLTAMEPPAVLDAPSIRNEKVKVLCALDPLTPAEAARRIVRGQYGAGEHEGETEPGYRAAEGIAPDSRTESYVALKVEIDNWRWAGVPFYLRTGKRLCRRASEIAVQFKHPPLHLFRTRAHEDFCLLHDRPIPNVLLLRIQPEEGISLSVACKQPGFQVRLREVDLDFFYHEVFQQRSPEAYERLLLDALRGDASLFTRSDEVEHAWRYVTSILDAWAEQPPAFPNYAPFSEGPEEASRLMEGTHARWRSIREM